MTTVFSAPPFLGNGLVLCATTIGASSKRGRWFRRLRIDRLPDICCDSFNGFIRQIVGELGQLAPDIIGAALHGAEHQKNTKRIYSDQHTFKIEPVSYTHLDVYKRQI